MAILIQDGSIMNPICNFSYDCLNKGNYDRDHNMLTCANCIKNAKNGKFMITDKKHPRPFVILDYKGDFYKSMDLPKKS